MKIIKLANGMEAMVDDEDYDYLMKYHWHTASRKKSPYAVRGTHVKGKHVTFYMHKEIMGNPIGMVVDHIDCNKLNNQKSNLRICTRAENDLNKKPTMNRRYVGVFPKRKKFRAQIRVAGKLYWLGCYETEREAAIAYNEAAIRLKGEFTQLNKIDD